MNLQEAKDILSTCERQESRDHAFGDVEVYWIRENQEMQQDEEVATGYFGGGSASVSVALPGTTDQFAHFEGLEAKELRAYGVVGHISRNDETGPDVFVEGYTAPGLSLADVRKELTGE